MRLPRSWYPLCRTADLRPAHAVAIEAFGGRLCAFRAADGTVGVIDARCGHAGADLARGAVVDGAVRCPMHGRRFRPDGSRADGGTGRCQRALRAIERWGVIFAFLGDGVPDFPLPEPEGIAAEVMTPVRVVTSDLELEVFGANAFDTAHLPLVHAREFAADPAVTDLGRWAIGLRLDLRVAGRGWRDRLLRATGHPGVTIETHCWGGNLLIFHHRRVGTFTVHAALPLGDRRTRVFTVSGRAAPSGALARAREAVRLRAHHRAVLAFVGEDEVALRGMRFHRGDLDPAADRSLIAWMDHFAELPRAEAWV